jgi:hypothetical protein
VASRLWRAALAGLAFAAAAAAMGSAISGRVPPTPALIAPGLLMAATMASGDRRFARRIGYGALALPLLALIALMALATFDRVLGAWTELGLRSMIYQAIGLASVGLGVIYGRRYGIEGGLALASVAGCWLTALAAVGWALPELDTAVLAREVAEAALAVAAGGLAGWLVGYGLGARRAAARAAIRPRP